MSTSQGVISLSLMKTTRWFRVVIFLNAILDKNQGVLISRLHESTVFQHFSCRTGLLLGGHFHTVILVWEAGVFLE